MISLSRSRERRDFESMTPVEEGTRRIKIKSEDFNLPPQGQSIGNNVVTSLKEREFRIQWQWKQSNYYTTIWMFSQNYNNRKVVTVIVKASFGGDANKGGDVNLYKNPWPTILAGESEAKKSNGRY